MQTRASSFLLSPLVLLFEKNIDDEITTLGERKFSIFPLFRYSPVCGGKNLKGYKYKPNMICSYTFISNNSERIFIKYIDMF